MDYLCTEPETNGGSGTAYTCATIVATVLNLLSAACRVGGEGGFALAGHWIVEPIPQGYLMDTSRIPQGSCRGLRALPAFWKFGSPLVNLIKTKVCNT